MYTSCAPRQEIAVAKAKAKAMQRNLDDLAGKENAQSVRFCNYCGASMTAPKPRTCPNCGAEAQPGVRFCGQCGGKLN